MEMIKADIADGFPVVLLCMQDGRLMLSPQGSFPVIVEQTPTGVSSVFHSTGFELGEGGEVDSYYYNTPYAYKQMPKLKAWLKQQNLVHHLARATQGETNASD